MPHYDPESLSLLPLFHGLHPSQLACAQNAMRCVTYPAGTEIMTFGQCSNQVYIILSGSVKIYICRSSRTEMILNILGAGEVLGELSAVDGLPHSASVITLETSSFARINQEAFSRILHELPLVSLNLVRILARRLRDLTNKAEVMSVLDVNGRIARQLLLFAEDYGRPVNGGGIVIPLRLTQSDIAGLVGASREKVNRTMTYLKRQQYISMSEDRHIIVRDLAGLSRCWH